jgi:Family of unknown function (DUF5771)
MMSRRTRKYSSNSGCPPGMTRRKGYVRSNTGTIVRSVCIRSTSPYKNNFKKTIKSKMARMRSRIASMTGTKKRCPPGQIMRSAYLRKISTPVAREGYIKKLASGKEVRVFPTSKSVLVPAGCIQDKGKKGKLPEGAPTIGPLRKGELRKFGYSYKLPEEQRHTALKRAIHSFGPLSTYRKLNAVSKYTVRSQPKASITFAADRNWIKNTYADKSGVLRAF